MKGIQTTYENMKPYVICMTNLIYIYIYIVYCYIVTLCLRSNECENQKSSKLVIGHPKSWWSTSFSLRPGYRDRCELELRLY